MFYFLLRKNRIVIEGSGNLWVWAKGVIRVDFAEDLTIFNKEKIKYKATFSEPHQYPEGIPYVILKDKLVIEDREQTGSLSDKLLKRGK